MIRYEIPQNWIQYNGNQLIEALVEAKAAVRMLTTIPYQKSWAEKLQEMQLKREVAGTSRIEGAEFTEVELDAALRETPEDLLNRSQKQARAAKQAYKWIAELPDDFPISLDLINEIHRRMITGADDDHCPPGKLRKEEENVNFGVPKHRGAEGGVECETAIQRLAQGAQREFREHDILIQALALHYHFASIHPYLDGNGRTGRALEALMLQRAGLRDTLFIAMSNYYYDEKISYLNSLSESRSLSHDLTPFLIFGLKGIALQCHRLFAEIRTHVSKALYRNVMYDLFNRLETKRKRVVVERQVQILKILLDEDTFDLQALYEKRLRAEYKSVSNPFKAYIRDISGLLQLQAIRLANQEPPLILELNLNWATEITETKFFESIKALPQAKTHPFL